MESLAYYRARARPSAGLGGPALVPLWLWRLAASPVSELSSQSSRFFPATLVPALGRTCCIQPWAGRFLLQSLINLSGYSSKGGGVGEGCPGRGIKLDYIFGTFFFFKRPFQSNQKGLETSVYLTEHKKEKINPALRKNHKPRLKHAKVSQTLRKQTARIIFQKVLKLSPPHVHIPQSTGFAHQKR